MTVDQEITLAAKAIRGLLISLTEAEADAVIDDAELAILSSHHQVANTKAIDVCSLVAHLPSGCDLSALKRAHRNWQPQPSQPLVIPPRVTRAPLRQYGAQS